MSSSHTRRGALWIIESFSGYVRGRWFIIWHHELNVDGKRLTSDYFFVIKSKSSTVKYWRHAIYLKHLKCCTKSLCVITETVSLMGNSSMPQSLEVRVDLQWTAVSMPIRPTVNRKIQTLVVKRPAIILIQLLFNFSSVFAPKPSWQTLISDNVITGFVRPLEILENLAFYLTPEKPLKTLEF